MSEKTAQNRKNDNGLSLPLSPLWSVRQEAFQTALSALVERDIATLQAYYDRNEDRAEPKPYEVVNGVAIVPLQGVLTRDWGWWSWLFGGTSIVQQRICLMQAAEDDEVESILLYAYSPGGEVYGIADFSGSVMEARKKKKVWGYAADECCSACYWAICRAEKIICNPTAIVGSIGIMQVVEDWSAAYRKQGVKVQVFKSGEYKGAGVPGTSLTEEQQAEYQRLVDAMAAQFFADVQEGRRLNDDQIETISSGQCWIGAEAVEMGLVDSLGTLEATVARMQPKETTQTNVRRPYGATHTTPTVQAATQEGKPMREFFAKLAAAFAQRGRHHLAAAALGAKEEDMDDLVKRLDAQVETEVKTALDTHPLLAALTSAKIENPDALQTLLQDAKDGQQARTDAQTQLAAAGVRLFKKEGVSQETVDSYVAAYSHLPVAQIVATTQMWEADADKLFNTDPNQPARRQTVPTALANVATDATPKPSVLDDKAKAAVRKTAEQVAKNGGTH